ncbi:MAG: hypothetical protein IKC49_02135 [Clostridia bacterium]|nr:hypothetical protein [Clostridia bacterium]
MDNKECQIHMMPTKISDEDISALFNGIINVVKKKYELDTKSHLININNNMNKLIKELNEKRAECNRLKNEILYLKSELAKNNTNS